MKYDRVFKAGIVILMALNLGTVILLASNKINSKEEAAEQTYMETASETAVAKKKSILEESDVEEVGIFADTDLGLITQAPIAAKVGKKIVFTVKGTCAGDMMGVHGLNGYMIKLESKSYGEYEWIPERAGIFEMVLVDREGNERTRRRINVASEERSDIYELTPVECSVDAQDRVTFNTSIFNTPTGSRKNEALPTTQFTIGEAGIWAKTIKAYGTSETDNERMKTSIEEGKDFFMDRGNYTVTASLKDLYSIEAEDTKTVSYEKKPADNHKVVIDDIEVISQKNSQNQNVERFVVHARCEHDKNKEPEDCELVYAFSVDDEVSTKNIVGSLNGYTTSNELTLPNMYWTYTVTAKVKHRRNSEAETAESKMLLPNAYETVAAKTVVKTGKEYKGIDIKNVKIQSCILDDYYQDKNNAILPTQVIGQENQMGTVYVNSNNYITVNVADDENPEHLHYTAFIVKDGQNIALEPVYESEKDHIGNKFVYYPKTGGPKSYNKNGTVTLSIIVTELNEDGGIKRKTTKNIGMSIK